MLSFSLLAGAFLCLSIEQRFACSRFSRTDVLSSQHRVYEVTKCAVEGAFMDVAAAFKNFFEGITAGRKIGYPRIQE